MLATLSMELSMSRSSRMEGGAMLSMLEWQEEREERSSEERDPSPEPPSALLTARGTLEPSFPLRVWRQGSCRGSSRSFTAGSLPSFLLRLTLRLGRLSSIREGGPISARLASLYSEAVRRLLAAIML